MTEPRAYYNEHDPKAVAWLKELMSENLIAAGEIDERSIEEIEPKDLDGFTQCHFFAGIGVWSYSLRAAGWSDDLAVWTGSCPCQPFSQSGEGEGFSDKRHLWPAWFRLIGERKPVCIFGEQVASKAGLAWFDIVSSDLEGTGYTIGATDLCAAGVGAPHIRQRLYFVADAGETKRRRWTESERNTGSGTERRFRAANNSGVGDIARGGCGMRGSAEERDETRGRSIADRSTGPASRTISAGHAVELADAEHTGFDRAHTDAPESRGDEPSNGLLVGSDSGLCSTVADAERDGRRADESGRRSQRREIDQRTGERSGESVADADGGNAGDGNEQRSGRYLELATNATAGFWRDAEWIYCRDGKWRPTKSGIFPLANGITGRVALLRGAGNALVAPVAQAFIEAYIEIINS